MLPRRRGCPRGQRAPRPEHPASKVVRLLALRPRRSRRKGHSGIGHLRCPKAHRLPKARRGRALSNGYRMSFGRHRLEARSLSSCYQSFGWPNACAGNVTLQALTRSVGIKNKLRGSRAPEVTSAARRAWARASASALPVDRGFLTVVRLVMAPFSAKWSQLGELSAPARAPCNAR